MKARLRCVVVAAAVACTAGLGGCAQLRGFGKSASAPAPVPAAAKDGTDVVTIDGTALQQLQQEQEEQVAASSAALAKVKTEASDYEYRIAPQDVLRVTVWNHPSLTNPSGAKDDLSGRVVNADGKFFFPYAGKVQAAGRTTDQIRDDLVRGLRRVIRDPQVDVAVMHYRGQRVYMSGEVRQPGALPLTDVPPDLTEMLARAGGFTADADLSNVTVTRRGQVVKVDVQALFQGGDARGNLRLRHGDVVNVPERRDAKVFVLGEVLRPTVVPMPKGRLSLADALNDAGVMEQVMSRPRQIYVLRGNEGPRARIYHLSAQASDALAMAERFRLQSLDVVYVDAKPPASWRAPVVTLPPQVQPAKETVVSAPPQQSLAQ